MVSRAERVEDVQTADDHRDDCDAEDETKPEICPAPGDRAVDRQPNDHDRSKNETYDAHDHASSQRPTPS